MKRMSLIVLPIVALVVLAFCNAATADLIPTNLANVDYEYSTTSTTQNIPWSVGTDPGNLGSPLLFTTPINTDEWVSVPNQAQSNKMKEFWLEVQWQDDLNDPPNDPPVLWVPQGYTAAADGAPVHDVVNNGWVWEWTITPQPNREMVDIPSSFWNVDNEVTKLIVASKCVPEPSMLALMASLGTLALVRLGWKRRMAR